MGTIVSIVPGEECATRKARMLEFASAHKEMVSYIVYGRPWLLSAKGLGRSFRVWEHLKIKSTVKLQL